MTKTSPHGAPEHGAATRTTPARPSRPRGMLIGAAGLLAAVIVMAAMILPNPAAPFTQPLDDWWRSIVGASPDSTIYTGPVPMLFQYLGGYGSLIILALAIIILSAIGRWRSMLFFVVGTVTPYLLAQVVKGIVGRPRPASDPSHGLYGPLFEVDHGSFPSGHLMIVAGLVIAVTALIPPTHAILLRVWWGAGAVLIAGTIWQRTLINAHWLSDTITGGIAGAGTAMVMWWLFWPLIQKDYGRPVWFLHPRPAKRTA